MIQPVRRTDLDSIRAHSRLVERAQKGGIELYFLGDSITRRWAAQEPEYADLRAHWEATFEGRKAANFGWGGDTTANILWRVQNGELDGVFPKWIVILAGTNDFGAGYEVDHVVRGLTAIVEECRGRAFTANLVLVSILPRTDRPELADPIAFANLQIRELAQEADAVYLDLWSRLVEPHLAFEGPATHDGLHPNLPVYQLWAEMLLAVIDGHRP